MNGVVFKPQQFPLFVVIPQGQWAEYEQFVKRQDDKVCYPYQYSEIHPHSHIQSSGVSSRARSPQAFTTKRSQRLFLSDEPSDDEDPVAASNDHVIPSDEYITTLNNDVVPVNEKVILNCTGGLFTRLTFILQVTSSISIKRQYVCSNSVISAMTKSPPTKKPFIVKVEPLLPDRSSLREALRVGGAADLDTSKCR